MRALIKPLRLCPSLVQSICCGTGRELSFSSPLQRISQDGINDMTSHFESKSRFLSSTVDLDLDYERDQLYDDGKVTEKDSSLSLAISQLASDFDRASNLCLSRFFCTRYASVISTGSLKLDTALGIGGLPKGRMVEIFGKEASGKTTIALHIIREAQKMGGYCAYIDVENAFSASLAEAVGVDVENLLITRPDCAENSLSIANTLIKSGSVDAIVVDSVAALVPQSELDSAIHVNLEEVQSRLMTKALRKIHFSLSRSQCLVIFINQVRAYPKSNQESWEELTCGGTALRFYAAIRLKLSRRALLVNEDEASGINISVQVVKNKLCPNLKKADLQIGFGTGIRREVEVLEIASQHGIINREGNGGSGYWINGEFFKDEKEAELFLVENSDVTDGLIRALRNHLFNIELENS